jgi:uncharacterized Zn-binding protein involved in type VI secretion
MQDKTVKSNTRIKLFMAKGLARANIDFAITHSNGDTHTAPDETRYIAGGGINVNVNGFPSIVFGDLIQCGDIVVETSTKVFINGKGVHRFADKLSAHAGTYTPTVCAQASSTVFAG